MKRLARVLSLPALALATACAVAATGGPAQTPIAVGTQAPDFTLPAIDGADRTLSQVAGKKPIVLVFFRGVW